VVGEPGDAPPGRDHAVGAVQAARRLQVHPRQAHVAFRDQVEKGVPFQTPSGKIEILCTELAQIADWKKTRYGEHVPSIPKWIEPWESLNSPKTKQFPFHLISPHPRWRTHSIFKQLLLAARDL